MRLAEGRHTPFIESKRCRERCFMAMVWVDENLVISAPKVNGGEDGGSLEVVDALFDSRNRISVLDGLGVESYVRKAHSDLVPLDLHEDRS